MKEQQNDFDTGQRKVIGTTGQEKTYDSSITAVDGLVVEGWFIVTVDPWINSRGCSWFMLAMIFDNEKDDGEIGKIGSRLD